MKNLSQRSAKLRQLIASLVEELELIDNELKLATSGYSCELAEVCIIQEMVAQHYGLTPNIMMSAIRTEEFANARGLAMYLAREMTFFGQKEIGNCFGGKTASMVLHDHNRIIERMQGNPSFANEVDELRKAAKWRIAEDLKVRKAKAVAPAPETQAIAS